MPVLGLVQLAGLALTEPNAPAVLGLRGRPTFQASGPSILVECHRAPLEGGFVISCVRRCRHAVRPGSRPGRLLQTLSLRDRVGQHPAHGVAAQSEHPGGLLDAHGGGHDGPADARMRFTWAEFSWAEFLGGPAQPQGRNGKSKPATLSMFEWVLTVERELVGAGR